MRRSKAINKYPSKQHQGSSGSSSQSQFQLPQKPKLEPEPPKPIRKKANCPKRNPLPAPKKRASKNPRRSKKGKRQDDDYEASFSDEDEESQGAPTMQKMKRTEFGHLPESFLGLLLASFDYQSEDELRQMIDKLIMKTNQTEKFYLKGYPYSNRHAPANHKQKWQRVYFQMDAGSNEVPLLINLSPSQINQTKTDITIKGVHGEVLMFFQNCSIEDLPMDVMFWLKSNSSSIIVQNRLSKRLQQYKTVPKILKRYPGCIWLDCFKKIEKEEIKTQAFEKETGVSPEGYFYVLSADGVNAFTLNNHILIERVKAAKQHLSTIQTFEQFIISGINKRYPNLQPNTAMLHVIINQAILNQKSNSRPTQIQIPKLINYLILNMLIHLSNMEGGKFNYISHFPILLEYSKFCMVCKKDNENNFQKFDTSRLKVRKTKYQCEACTNFFKMQIKLCLLCFKKFHDHMQYYVAKPKQDIESIELPPPYDQLKSDSKLFPKEGKKKENVDNSANTQRIQRSKRKPQTRALGTILEERQSDDQQNKKQKIKRQVERQVEQGQIQQQSQFVPYQESLSSQEQQRQRKEQQRQRRQDYHQQLMRQQYIKWQQERQEQERNIKQKQKLLKESEQKRQENLIQQGIKQQIEGEQQSYHPYQQQQCQQQAQEVMVKEEQEQSGQIRNDYIYMWWRVLQQFRGMQ